MQALPRFSGATAASKDAVNATSLHQHSTANEPAAEAAHALGLPQSGQSGA